MKNEIVIFENQNVRLEVNLKDETVWLSLDQMAELFGRDKREKEVYTKIQDAAKAVMVEQKLDAVMDARGVFVGGVDITQSVISKLKFAK